MLGLNNIKRGIMIISWIWMLTIRHEAASKRVAWITWATRADGGMVDNTADRIGSTSSRTWVSTLPTVAGSIVRTIRTDDAFGPASGCCPDVARLAGANPDPIWASTLAEWSTGVWETWALRSPWCRRYKD